MVTRLARCWASGAAGPLRRASAVGALRLVTDREREILAFVPVESWTLDAQLHKDTDPADQPDLFSATLHSVKGSRNRLNIPVEEEARKV